MRESFLTGNIGKVPETFTPEGSEWTCLSFSIANNEETKKVNEQWENITSWYDLEYWTKKPGEWLQKLTKGKKVICHCKVKQQTWTDSTTNKQRSKIVFIVEKWPEEGKATEGHHPSSNPPQGNNNQRNNQQGNNSHNTANNSRGNDLNNQYLNNGPKLITIDYNPKEDPKHKNKPNYENYPSGNQGGNGNFEDDIPF